MADELHGPVPTPAQLAWDAALASDRGQREEAVPRLVHLVATEGEGGPTVVDLWLLPADARDLGRRLLDVYQHFRSTS